VGQWKGTPVLELKPETQSPKDIQDAFRLAMLKHLAENPQFHHGSIHPIRDFFTRLRSGTKSLHFYGSSGIRAMMEGCRRLCVRY